MKGEYQETKDNLAFAFVDLLQTKDVDSITVTEICKTANYSRDTFYYYFQDKYDLISWVFYAQINWYITKYFGTESFEIILIRILKGMQKIKPFYIKGFSQYKYESLEQTMVNQSTKIYTDMLQKATEKHELSETTQYLIHFNAGGVVSMIKHWMTRTDNISATYLAEMIYHSMSKELTGPFDDYKKNAT